MFSGVVEESAVVTKVERRSNDAARIGVVSTLDHHDTRCGDSIAIDGICLTVVAIARSEDKTQTELEFDLASETLRATTFQTLHVGSAVHLERSLQLGARLHGHFVFGHGDGEAELLGRSREGDCERLLWRIPARLVSLVVPKGSIAIAGVSLTVGEVQEDTVSVYIIPHTSSVTRLGTLAVGTKVNLEVDQLARYVARNLACAKLG